MHSIGRGRRGGGGGRNIGMVGVNSTTSTTINVNLMIMKGSLLFCPVLLWEFPVIYMFHPVLLLRPALWNGVVQLNKSIVQENGEVLTDPFSEH